MAEFRIHDAACSPVNGGTITVRPTTGLFVECADANPQDFGLSAAFMQHYGPIAASGSTPFIVEVRPVGGGSWSNVTSSHAVQEVSGSAQRRWRLTRTGGNAKLLVDHEYRVSPQSNPALGALRSVLPSGLTATVAGYPYTFTIRYECDEDLLLLGGYDVNLDSTLNAGDVSAWTAAPTDLNRDAAANAADLYDLGRAIDRWNQIR